MSVIPIFVPMQLFPMYVKKKELEEYILKQRKQVKVNQLIMYSALLFSQILIPLLVLPQLMQLYAEFDLQFPAYSLTILILSFVIGIVCLLTSLRLAPLNEELLNKIRQDKDEMVSIHSTLINKKIVLIGVLYAALAFSTLFISHILPIFSLSSI